MNDLENFNQKEKWYSIKDLIGKIRATGLII